MGLKFNTALRPAGIILIEDPESPRQIEQSTLQCVHCGRHFMLVKPGKTSHGTVPGTCWTCNGPVCGPKCATCAPQEQQLDNMEAGRDVLTPRPAMAAFQGKSKLILPD